MMTLEDYLRKYYTQKSDSQIARLYCTTVYRVTRLRQKMRLHRDHGYKDHQMTLSEAERLSWYQGTFNVRETEWELSGLTK